jgi:hypothetical protein
MAAKKTPTVRKKATRPTPAWKSKPTTIEGYLESLSPEKRDAIVAARKLVQANIPKGYSEFMNWGCINWGIPLSEFSNTYNGHPITYIALGANKNKNSLHLMACYVDGKRIAFLKDEFKKAGKTFDMGKSCLHFNTLDDLELKSVAKVIGSVSKERYLAMYKKFKGL